MVPEHLASHIRKLYTTIEAGGNLTTRMLPPLLIYPPQEASSGNWGCNGNTEEQEDVPFEFSEIVQHEHRLFLKISPAPFPPVEGYYPGVYLCTLDSTPAHTTNSLIPRVEQALEALAPLPTVQTLSPKHLLYTTNPLPWSTHQVYEIRKER